MSETSEKLEHLEAEYTKLVEKQAEIQAEIIALREEMKTLWRAEHEVKTDNS